MGKSKKPKKKKGCIGMLFNLVLFTLCLVATGLLFYFAMLVVKGNPDPVGELKKLPEQIKVLPEIIKERLNKDPSGEAAN